MYDYFSFNQYFYKGEGVYLPLTCSVKRVKLEESFVLFILSKVISYAFITILVNIFRTRGTSPFFHIRVDK